MSIDSMRGDDSKPERASGFNWLRAVLLSVALPLFVALGVWQLDRASQKRELLAQYGQSERVLTSASQAERLLAGQQLQPVSLDLQFDTDHLIYLDNRTLNGQAGYHLIAPAGVGSGWILVSLGWIPAGPDRSLLPTPKLPTEPLTNLHGTLRAPVQTLLLSDRQDADNGWPLRVQRLEPEQLGRQLQHSLPTVIIELHSSVVDEVVPHQQSIKSMPPERHLGYAVQWFALALALAVWLAWSIWRDRRQDG